MMLTNQQLAELRRAVARGRADVPWDKGTINAALQAIEDAFEANRTTLEAAVDVSTAALDGRTFAKAEKAELISAWSQQKATREAT